MIGVVTIKGKIRVNIIKNLSFVSGILNNEKLYVFTRDRYLVMCIFTEVLNLKHKERVNNIGN